MVRSFHTMVFHFKVAVELPTCVDPVLTCCSVQHVSHAKRQKCGFISCHGPAGTYLDWIILRCFFASIFSCLLWSFHSLISNVQVGPDLVDRCHWFPVYPENLSELTQWWCFFHLRWLTSVALKKSTCISSWCWLCVLVYVCERERVFTVSGPVVVSSSLSPGSCRGPGAAAGIPG